MIFCEYIKDKFPDCPKRVYVFPDRFLVILKGHKKGDIALKSVKIEDKEIDFNSLLQVLVL